MRKVQLYEFIHDVVPLHVRIWGRIYVAIICFITWAIQETIWRITLVNEELIASVPSIAMFRECAADYAIY